MDWPRRTCCGRSSCYFCHVCCKPLPPDDSAATVMPRVKLPIRVGIMLREERRKSTGLHAKVLAPEHVDIYSPDDTIPEFNPATTVVAFPSAQSTTWAELDDVEQIDNLLLLCCPWQQYHRLLELPQLSGLRHVVPRCRRRASSGACRPGTKAISRPSRRSRDWLKSTRRRQARRPRAPLAPPPSSRRSRHHSSSDRRFYSSSTSYAKRSRALVVRMPHCRGRAPRERSGGASSSSHSACASARWGGPRARSTSMMRHDRYSSEAYKKLW